MILDRLLFVQASKVNDAIWCSELKEGGRGYRKTAPRALKLRSEWWWIQTPMDMINLSSLWDFNESLLVELRSVKDIYSAVTSKDGKNNDVTAERKIPMLLMLLLMLELKSNWILVLLLKVNLERDRQQAHAHSPKDPSETAPLPEANTWFLAHPAQAKAPIHEDATNHRCYNQGPKAHQTHQFRPLLITEAAKNQQKEADDEHPVNLALTSDMGTHVNLMFLSICHFEFVTINEYVTINYWPVNT